MPSSVTRKERRVSRITTACNPCRSRKQKCSGERPVCGQCLEYHRQCAWPEQLKRGPAKGYIEALEARLYETENVLLKLLSHLSQSQLSSMLSENESEPGKGDHVQQDAHGFWPLSRQREVESWKANPLTSVDNIRRWEQESLDLRNRPDTENHDADNTTPTRRPRRNRPTTISKHDGPVVTSKKLRPNTGQDHHLYNRFQEEQLGHSRRYSEEIGDYSQDTTETPPQPITTTASPFDVPSNFGPVYHTREYTTSTPRTTPQLSAWEEAPSINFQKQFLW